jgi:chromosome partitioning protein
MTRSIVVANQQGGVGKTTTVASLGAALVSKGNLVAIVDLDSQGALTVSFGLDPYVVRPSTYELLLQENTSLDLVLHPLKDNFHIAPANTALLSSEYKLIKEKNRSYRLQHSIDTCNNSYDFILIDTPPNLGLLTLNALVAGNELLIPVASDYLAMRGVRAIMETVWYIRKNINPKLRLLGLVITLYKENSLHSKAVVAEMKKVFRDKVFQTVIPLDEAASAAPAARKSVIDYQPSSRVAKSYIQLAEEVINVGG